VSKSEGAYKLQNGAKLGGSKVVFLIGAKIATMTNIGGQKCI